MSLPYPLDGPGGLEAVRKRRERAVSWARASSAFAPHRGGMSHVFIVCRQALAVRLELEPATSKPRASCEEIMGCRISFCLEIRHCRVLDLS
jgi:hypothetical protein